MSKMIPQSKASCRTIFIMAAAMTLALAWGLSPVCAQGVPTVVVDDEAWVTGEKVYLGDVARIEGPDSIHERLGTIYLAYAPSPGNHKTLHGSWIESKIRSKKWVPGDALLEVPEYVRIGRAFQYIQDEDFERHYTAFISQHLKDEDADLTISRFRVTGNGPLPEGDVDIELSRQGHGKIMGHVGLTAIARVNGNMERRLVLSGWVDRYEKVVCTVKPLPRHATVSPEDVCLERQNVSRLADGVARSVETVIGKRVKHAVKEGAVLMANAVENPPLIQKGDRVTIIAESCSLRITAVGIAKSKGGMGDQIPVKNLASNKEIIASVVDGSTVSVEF